MKTFLKIVRESKVPRDGFYYPRAYDVVNEKLQQYCVSGRSEQVGCDNCADWKQGNDPDKYCLVCNRLVEL